MISPSWSSNHQSCSSANRRTSGQHVCLMGWSDSWDISPISPLSPPCLAGLWLRRLGENHPVWVGQNQGGRGLVQAAQEGEDPDRLGLRVHQKCESPPLPPPPELGNAALSCSTSGTTWETSRTSPSRSTGSSSVLVRRRLTSAEVARATQVDL